MKRARSRLDLVGWPVVRFSRRVTAPAIERIIEPKASIQLREIVIVDPRQAERGGEKARRFGAQIEPRGIGGANDRREPQQWRRRQPELLDHHIERAELTAMAPERVLDV